MINCYFALCTNSWKVVVSRLMSISAASPILLQMYFCQRFYQQNENAQKALFNPPPTNKNPQYIKRIVPKCVAFLNLIITVANTYKTQTGANSKTQTQKSQHKRKSHNINANSKTQTPTQKHTRKSHNTNANSKTHTQKSQHRRQFKNTNANSKTQTPIQKHKRQFKNTNANSKTQTTFQKHKRHFRNTNAKV